MVDQDKLIVQWLHTGSLNSGKKEIPVGWLQPARSMGFMVAVMVLAYLVIHFGGKAFRHG